MYTYWSTWSYKKEDLQVQYIALKQSNRQMRLYAQMEPHQKSTTTIPSSLYAAPTIAISLLTQTRGQSQPQNFSPRNRPLLYALVMALLISTSHAYAPDLPVTNNTCHSPLVALSHEYTDSLIVSLPWQSQLYIPWREEYKKHAETKTNDHGCSFCSQIDAHDDDRYLILNRTNHFVVQVDLYPKSKGHLLIIPYAHVKRLEDLSQSARGELMELQVKIMEIIKESLHTDSFNVGFNIGQYSGATVPNHLHAQIIPRYKDERSGFIETIANTKQITWDLKKLYEQLRLAFHGH